MAKKSNFFQAFLQTASVTVLGASGLVILGVALFVFNIYRGLPEVASLKNFQHPHATEVYSAEGRRIGEFTTERRYAVKYETIPKHVISAFISAEDSHFFEHKGIDYGGIARAFLSNMVKGRYAQGGSTITQQVARGILLETRKKEITRKVREMILARRMEEQLTKDEIMGLYLNEIYLGHGSYGLGAAAQNYFNKKVSELTIAEGAMLAGLPQRPNDWDPFHNANMAKRRQTYVLKRMLEEQAIDQKQFTEASKQVLRLYALEDPTNKAAPYFAEYVRQYVMAKYGAERVLSEGFRIHTTVRYDLQKIAEKSVDRGLREVDKRLGWRGAVANLKTSEEVNAFFTKTHDQVLDELNPVRLLMPDAETAASRRLGFDLRPFEDKTSHFYGTTPVAEGKYYDAIVQEVQDSKGMVLAQVGQTKVQIPFAGMAWVKVNEEAVKQPSQVVKVNDVIQVRVDKLDKKAGVVTASLEQQPEVQGALLSYEVGNGEVRAMVGGTDFQKSKFNCALQAKRQVGSTFKPLIYAAAIDKGYSPSSLVTDAPIVFEYDGALDADSQGEPWRPQNYGGKFEGDIPLRLALVRSMNIPTVKILNEITVDYGIQYARTLGITATLPRDLTIGLGSWSSSLEELMRAYAIFPRLGKPINLKYITKITDGNGKVLEDYTAVNAVPSPVPGQMSSSVTIGSNAASPADPNKDLVISPQTAYVMTDMLKSVVREGTGRAAHMGGVYPIAGKTGTSNDHRDAWFVGYSPEVVTGVWLGYEKDKPLDIGETGGKAAAPIFGEYMSMALKDYPKGDFAIPDDVVFAYVDRDTGRLSQANSPNRVRVAFKMGTVPNMRGDNILRIGEPGTGNRAIGASDKALSEPEDSDLSPSALPQDDETSDFMREGYQ